MLFSMLVRIFLGVVVTHWLVRRLFWLVFSVLVVTVTLLLLGSALAGRAAAEEYEDGKRTVSTSQAARTEVLAVLAPEILPQQSVVARGRFFRSVRTVVAAPSWPSETRVVLSRDPDGSGQIEVDDVAQVVIRRADGIEQHVELGFQREDGNGVQSWNPIDVTALIGRGELTVELTLIDLHPPVSWSSSMYLVVLHPHTVHLGPGGQQSTERFQNEPDGAAGGLSEDVPPQTMSQPSGRAQVQDLLSWLSAALTDWWPVAVVAPLMLLLAGGVSAMLKRRLGAAFDGGLRDGSDLGC